MSESEANTFNDVLVIDNMGDQARMICQKVEGGDLQVVPLLVSIAAEDVERGLIPAKKTRRVLTEIHRLRPKAVLVDICLYEQPMAQKSSIAAKSATWTGPALMAAIRDDRPDVKIASYSAYPCELTDIVEQRRKHGVGDTPHWHVREVNRDVIHGLLGQPANQGAVCALSED